MPRKAKIASELSPEQLSEFFKRLGKLKNPTLERVADLAGEFGVELSLMSASTARDLFEEHRDKLSRASERSQELVNMLRGTESTPLQGAAALAQSEIFDELCKPDAERDMVKVAKAINHLSSVYDRDERLKIAQAEAERKDAEWQQRQQKIKAACENGRREGISDETLARIEEAAGLL